MQIMSEPYTFINSPDIDNFLLLFCSKIWMNTSLLTLYLFCSNFVKMSQMNE